MYTKHAHVATSSPAHTDTDGFKIYANFLYFSYQDTVGGRSKREGTYVYIWSIHFIGQQKLTQHCKATIFQKKEKSNVLSFFFFFLYWVILSGSVVKNPPAMQETCRQCRFDPWVRKIPWSRKWQPTPVLLSGESHA